MDWKNGWTVRTIVTSGAEYESVQDNISVKGSLGNTGGIGDWIEIYVSIYKSIIK